MKKIEFEEMSLIEQGMVLVSKGKHLTQVNHDGFLLNLYSVADFFVEVYYSTNANKVEKIKIIEDLSRIDLYIEENQKNNKIEFSQYSYN